MTYDRKKGVAGPHVLIVGAGITGLLIAQGLKKVWLLISEHDTGVGRYIQFQAGDGYTIFDAEPLGIGRPREWTLGIHWSIPILEKLLTDLSNRLFEAQCDPGLVAGLDYTIEMIKRGAEEANLSIKTALMAHDWTVFMDSPLMKHGTTKMS